MFLPLSWVAEARNRLQGNPEQLLTDSGTVVRIAYFRDGERPFAVFSGHAESPGTGHLSAYEVEVAPGITVPLADLRVYSEDTD